MNDEFTELYTGIMEMSLKDESLFVPDEDSSLLKIRRRQMSVTASGSEITARKTSGCRR